MPSQRSRRSLIDARVETSCWKVSSCSRALSARLCTSTMRLCALLFVCILTWGCAHVCMQGLLLDRWRSSRSSATLLLVVLLVFCSYSNITCFSFSTIITTDIIISTNRISVTTVNIIDIFCHYYGYGLMFDYSYYIIVVIFS